VTRGDPERLRLARPSLSRRETASAKRNRSSAAARTPSSQTPDARPVRVVGLPRLLSRRAATSLACRPPYGKDVSHQSLQPTCCHEYPRSHPSPSSGLSPFRPPRSSSCIRLGGSPAFHSRPSSATLNCHCWLSSLGSAAQLVLRRPAATEPSPPKGRAVSRAAIRAGFVVPTRTRWSGSQTPHVATRSLRSASRAHPREPEPASPHPNQRERLFEPKAPSTSKSHRRRPSSRPNDDRMGRHWYPGFAASGPASDMRSRSNPRSARPSCLPTIRRGPKATCRLPASAMDCHPSTPTCRPISGVVRGKPRPAR